MLRLAVVFLVVALFAFGMDSRHGGPGAGTFLILFVVLAAVCIAAGWFRRGRFPA